MYLNLYTPCQCLYLIQSLQQPFDVGTIVLASFTDASKLLVDACSFFFIRLLAEKYKQAGKNWHCAWQITVVSQGQTEET